MTERDDVLAAERAVNEQYRVRLAKEMEENRTVLAEVTSLCRSAIWTTGTPMKGAKPGPVPPVVGRVDFDDDSEFVDGFYIGPRYQEWGRLMVLSWAAPVAQLFFEGRRSSDPAAATVAARRSFVTNHSDIVDFADDVEVGVDPATVFRHGGGEQLDVPKAPRKVRRPLPTPKPKPARPSVEPTPPSPTEVRDTRTRVPSTTSPRAAKPKGADEPAPDVPLRAERAVLRAVEKPRSGHLDSVLATLQPDQYELVTWPADEPLIVAGSPGTGKTVVALHRAGYLTHLDRADEALDRVAVVGPTDEYREHVRRVTRQVGGKDVVIHGLPSLLARLAGVDHHRMKPSSHDWVGVSWELGSVVERVQARMHRQRPRSTPSVKALVNELVQDSELHRASVGENRELSVWLRSIGTFERAKTETGYLPFLAACGLATRSITEDQIDHLIVDEAQDVPPLVWRILDRLLRPGGSMTLFGDMNQRRCDSTASSWEELARDMELTDDDGRAPLRYLTTGYRTTRQILKFANQLLPKEQRAVHALREGIRPVVQKVSRKNLVAETVSAATALSRGHSEGLTAVISPQPVPFSDGFRAAGWQRGQLKDSWTRDGMTVVVLHPDQARGLEFDGVVVVEPKEFPGNLGRDGVLYTSLTRATKELVLIHTRGLPTNLRAPR